MPRFVEIAGCACPAQLAPAVLHVMHATGSSPLSLYRGEDPQAVAILHRNGKGTQADLVADPRRYGVIGTPNPVGQSTHELCSDGRAFRGPIGRRLAPIECGQDWPDADVDRVMAAYRKLGCAPIRPYPGGTEHHHICCTRLPAKRIDPLLVLGVLPLKPGERSARVRMLQVYLVRGKLLPRRFAAAHRRGTYGPVSVAAVQRFQRRLGLEPDGVVGPRTFAALRRRYGWRIWSRGARR
ncbi:MAG TPA: peptidoglycan-binding domain-containing protein [Conexibacter sp.]|nr:peptidoglycan-binding domain-containing protein [Conexibacter sp.]